MGVYDLAWVEQVKVVEERWGRASGYGSSGYPGYGGWDDGYAGRNGERREGGEGGCE